MTDQKTAEVKVVPVRITPEMAHALESNFAECVPPNAVHAANWQAAWEDALALAPSHIGEAAGMVVPAQSGWRGMESAPKKHGALILMFDGHSVFAGEWGHGRYDRSSRTYEEAWTCGPQNVVNPTHWMPLPEAPGSAPAFPPAETGEGLLDAINLAAGRGNGEPVPVTIFCPLCDVPHVDEGEWARERKHKTHQCQGCGHEWRPFPFATVGVAHPAQPVSPSEPAAWVEPSDIDHVRRVGPLTATLHPREDGDATMPLYTHPASDQSDTERMRAALAIATDTLSVFVNASENVGRKHFREEAAETLARIAALAEKAADK